MSRNNWILITFLLAIVALATACTVDVPAGLSVNGTPIPAGRYQIQQVQAATVTGTATITPTATITGTVTTTATATATPTATSTATTSSTCIDQKHFSNLMVMKKPLFEDGRFAGAQGTLLKDFSTDGNPWVDHIDRESKVVQSAPAGVLLTIWIKESSRCN